MGRPRRTGGSGGPRSAPPINFSLPLTPQERLRYQKAADTMAKRLGVPVSLAAFLRHAADRAVEQLAAEVAKP